MNPRARSVYFSMFMSSLPKPAPTALKWHGRGTLTGMLEIWGATSLAEEELTLIFPGAAGKSPDRQRQPPDEPARPPARHLPLSGQGTVARAAGAHTPGARRDRRGRPPLCHRERAIRL